MMRAILSDIHGNLEALQAVLQDIQSQDVDEIYCLGDIVGYGPNPRECIDMVQEFNLCILGNHDQGALFDPEGFSSGAEKAIFWTREQLEQPDHGNGVIRRWNFLAELPRSWRESPGLYVHGSPRNPLNEYVFPEDIYNARKIEKLFSLVEQFCFQGHTHVPGVFTEDLQFLTPADAGQRYRLGSQKVMVNVGSVGQPRDGDWRSSYVLFDGEQVYFRRVEYELDQTIDKIYSEPDLDNFLGDRLREGR